MAEVTDNIPDDVLNQLRESLSEPSDDEVNEDVLFIVIL